MTERNPQDDPERRIRELEPPPAWVDVEPTRPGMRLGWIVLGVLVLGLVVGGGAMIAERVGAQNKPVAGRPTAPPVVGGGGSFAPRPPTPSPLIPVPPPPPTGAQISVAGIDKDETYACNASSVSVSGVRNRVLLTGHCARVDVSGVGNTVLIEESDAIVVSGLDNTVTFRFGSPEVDQSGFDNKVARA